MHQNQEQTPDEHTQHLTVQEIDSGVLDWFQQLQEGADISDEGQTYIAPDADVYPRGGTLGANAAQDSDDAFWERHLEGNPSQRH